MNAPIFTLAVFFLTLTAMSAVCSLGFQKNDNYCCFATALSFWSNIRTPLCCETSDCTQKKCRRKLQGNPTASVLENQEIMTWYRKHNIMVSSKVRVDSVSGLRGIFATGDLVAGEAVAAIPPEMIVRSQFKNLQDAFNTLERHLSSESRTEFKMILARLQGECIDQKTLLAFRLLELVDSKPDIWRPFEHLCLPIRIPNFYMMNEAELAKILIEPQAAVISSLLAHEQVEASRREAELQIPQLLQVYSYIYPGVTTTSERLLWALSVAQSRAVLGLSGLEFERRICSE